MTTPSPATAPVIQPDDEHNRALLAHVRPADWANPVPAGRYNLVVIGAGTAGLVTAAGAAGLGARVALVERHLMGGDCLNYGCVPSKALLSAARAAAGVRHAAAFGVSADHVSVDFGAVMARMRRLRAGIAKHDSVARFAGLGIDVFQGDARFVSPDAVAVEGATLRFARAVIATGARAAAPPISGLEETGYLTNETVFSLTELPRRLIVIGAGPIGCELAQAFRRFGSEVTVVSRDPQVLPREDADAAKVVRASLERDGVTFELGASIASVERRPGHLKSVTFEQNGAKRQVVGDEILVAVGRTPNLDSLDLAAAGVTRTERGVTVDDRMRTTNPRVFAAGDVASRYQFTHAADAMARIVIQNALFFGRKKASALVVPWATYTDPELAHVGLSAEDAESRGASVRTLTVRFAELDRAIVDGETDGFARVHVDARSGTLLGATLVGPHGGDLIGEMVLAISRGTKVGALAGVIHPYPTRGEAWRKLGDAWNRTRLTPRVRWWFETFLRFRR